MQIEKGNLVESIRKKNDEYRKLPDAVSKAVKTRFDKACADGLGVFADLAIFQALSAAVQSAESPNPSSNKISISSLVEPVLREVSPSGGDTVSVLRSFGVSGKKAEAFVLVCETAFQAGLIVCVRGIAARPAVEDLARMLNCRGFIIDSTVGLIDNMKVKNILNQGPQVVVVLDANLSALDIYAKSLSDLVLERVSKPEIERLPKVLLTLSDSVGALSLPQTFERISVMIDLDAHYDFCEVDSIEDLMSSIFDSDEGTLFQRMWRPAVKCLRKQVDELDPANQVLVLSVLNVIS